jgi:hypothetical protein
MGKLTTTVVVDGAIALELCGAAPGRPLTRGGKTGGLGHTRMMANCSWLGVNG